MAASHFLMHNYDQMTVLVITHDLYHIQGCKAKIQKTT